MTKAFKGGETGPARRLDAHDARRLAEEATTIDASDPRRVAASVAMFDLLIEHWSLRGGERETLLGGIAKSTWSEWRQRTAVGRIKPDTRERIANLFAIDVNAHALFAPEFADRWVREPNAAFEGRSPLATMLRGKVEDMIRVRLYLERVRSASPTDDSRALRSGQESVGMSALPGTAFDHGEVDPTVSMQRVLDLCQRRADEHPSRYEPVLAAMLDAYAAALVNERDRDALPVLERAVALFSRLASENTVYEDDLARNLLRLGTVFRMLGDEEAAVARFDHCRMVFARRLDRNEPVEVTLSRVYDVLFRNAPRGRDKLA